MIVPSYWFSSGGLTDLERLHRYLEEMPEIGKVASLVQIHDIATDLSGRNLNDLELSIMRQTLNEEITNQLIKPYWDQNFVRILQALRCHAIFFWQEILRNIVRISRWFQNSDLKIRWIPSKK